MTCRSTSMESLCCSATMGGYALHAVYTYHLHKTCACMYVKPPYAVHVLLQTKKCAWAHGDTVLLSANSL